MNNRNYNKVKKHRDGSVKLFGFRSGIAWKMIPALLYYVFALYFFVSSVIGECIHYKFESMDILLTIFRYIFIFILIFSPIIFLSNYKLRDKLPLFKYHSFGMSLFGMIIVWIICYLMFNLNIYVMSDTWSKSRDSYTKKIEKELKNNEITTTFEDITK